MNNSREVPHADFESARGTVLTHRVGERLYGVLISQVCFERFSLDPPMSADPENGWTAVAVGEFPDLSSSDAEQISCSFDREQFLIFQIRQICLLRFLLLLFLLFFHYLHQVGSTHILLHDRGLILFKKEIHFTHDWLPPFSCDHSSDSSEPGFFLCHLRASSIPKSPLSRLTSRSHSLLRTLYCSGSNSIVAAMRLFEIASSTASLKRILVIRVVLQFDAARIDDMMVGERKFIFLSARIYPV